MRVLIIGNGGREHALAWKLKQSAIVSELFFVPPDNAGMSRLATVLEFEPNDKAQVVRYADLAEENQIDFTIVGGENPLAAGVVDEFQKRGLLIFGPTAAAARLEGSKIWAKRLMEQLSIPTAAWRDFTEASAALAYARELGWRCVVKADGLAAGKGSFVCQRKEQVEHAVKVLLKEGRFGTRAILIEEFLPGQELSVFALSDGRTVIPFGAAQDHKRRFDKDRGPNTGGMGSYSPVDHMKFAQSFAEDFFEPIVARMAEQGTPYIGVLYAGAIATRQGPRILEFNCRFGDPEAEVLLRRLGSDLGEILLAASSGRLHEIPELNWAQQEALCVVLCTEAYPGSGDVATPISGLAAAENIPGVVVFHAGTRMDGRRLKTHGGRILSVSAVGKNLVEAQKRAYRAVEKIKFEGKDFRRDIGTKAIGKSWETFAEEYQKRPPWHRVTQAIEEVAAQLSEIQLKEGSISDVSAGLQAARDRLYGIRGFLDPRSPDSSLQSIEAPESAVETALEALSGEFDAMVREMQAPDVAAGWNRAFSATSGEISDAAVAEAKNRIAKRD